MNEACYKIAEEQKPKTTPQRTLLYIEEYFNKIFTPQYNPLYYLGAISCILYLIIVISGIYLFIFYRIGDPYLTVQNMTEKQWYFGGVMRSIHRYASDGLIIALTLHLIREYLNRRYSHNRWLAWVTGVILLIITIIMGIIGYWLVWDERAQLVALKTAEILNDIPIFIEPISMSFLKNESLHALLFFVLHLVHLALPVALIIVIGLHVFRCSRPVIATPKIMTYAILIMLFAAAIIMPAKNAGRADLSKLPIDIPFDWFYFFIFFLWEQIPKTIFWIITTGITILLLILPWTKRHKLHPAQVILENCTGCEQCNIDCPYEAIRMRFGSDRLLRRAEATVISERCTSCGVCIGACDFGAINLPEITEAGIKEEMVRLLSASGQADERPKILLLICSHSDDMKDITDIKNRFIKGMANVKMIILPCIGMVQPSMIEKGFESGADGVFLCGCLTNDCHYREGNKWLHERVAGGRFPFLSKAIDLRRIREFHVSAINTDKLIDELRLFEEYLKKPDKMAQAAESKANGKRILKRLTAFSAIPLFFILFFSIRPIYPFYSKGDSLIKLAIKYSSRFKAECRELTEKETEGKLRHMRKTESPFSNMRMDCAGERLPISIEISLDNKNISTKTYYPSGMKNDGPTFVYDEIHAAPGMHKLIVKIKDSKEVNPLDYKFEKEVEIKSGEVAVIDLSNMF